jgi:signal transduction histidine kinase
MIGAMQDLTERKRAAEMEQERNNLRGAVRALDRVLGVVGHELRTPLAAVRALSEVVLMHHQWPSGECRTYLESIRDQVVQMAGVVNDLLEVARLNSGTAKWNWSRFALAEACGEAAETVRPLLDGQKVSLSVRVRPEDLHMNGDADAVRRLTLNLLSNAQKHTPAGEILVDVAAESAADGAWVRLLVSDTGEGMSADTASKLGEAFALNSGVVGADYIKGSGLGLAICRGIVAAHGGRISFASAPGKGTTVTVLLRADLPAPPDKPPAVAITVAAAA